MLFRSPMLHLSVHIILLMQLCCVSCGYIVVPPIQVKPHSTSLLHANRIQHNLIKKELASIMPTQKAATERGDIFSYTMQEIKFWGLLTQEEEILARRTRLAQTVAKEQRLSSCDRGPQ